MISQPQIIYIKKKLINFLIIKPNKPGSQEKKPFTQNFPQCTAISLCPFTYIFGETLSLLSFTKVHQHNGIFDKIELELMVERSIRRKTRTMVHLQQPRLKFVVQHYVHTQDFETHRIRVRLRLARPVVVRQMWLNACNC